MSLKNVRFLSFSLKKMKNGKKRKQRYLRENFSKIFCCKGQSRLIMSINESLWMWTKYFIKFQLISIIDSIEWLNRKLNQITVNLENYPMLQCETTTFDSITFNQSYWIESCCLAQNHRLVCKSFWYMVFRILIVYVQYIEYIFYFLF